MKCVICRKKLIKKQKRFCSYKCYWKSLLNPKKLDLNRWKKWSPIFCYFLGIIASDGHIDIKRNTIGITSIDKETIKKFQKFVGNPLYVYQYNNAYRITLCNKQIIEILNKKGFSKPKFQRALPFIPKKYLKYFILGYFDGDGNANWAKKSCNKTVTIDSGNKEFIKSLSLLITKNYNIKNSVHELKNGSFYRLQFTNVPARALYKLMYDNKSIEFCLSRKHIKLKEMFSDD